MAEKNMNAKISVEFEETANRQQLSSGDNLPTLFGKIKKIISDLSTSAFSGSYIDLSDRPTTATTDTDGLMSASDKTKLDNADDTYALKSRYGDNGINLGRLANSSIGFLSSTIGRANAATGAYSFSQGFSNIATGDCSFASGNSSRADGENAFAHGHAVNARKDNEIAFGEYNESSSNTIFSIGDGTAGNARHNAFEITKTDGKLHDKDIMTTGNISNSNLLINPNFKINQRGISGEFSETGKYLVDRWKLVSGTVTVNSDGTLTLNGTISQKFENAVGTNVIASTSAGTAVYDDDTGTFSITASGTIISWAKLEYGNIPTEFIIPNVTIEQLKCQRYYLGLNTYIRYPMTRLTSNTIDFLIPINAMFRATPTLLGNPIVYDSINAISRIGFTFTIAAIGINAVVIRATKTNHGLSLAYLDMTNGVSFDAEIG